MEIEVKFPDDESQAFPISFSVKKKRGGEDSETIQGKIIKLLVFLGQITNVNINPAHKETYPFMVRENIYNIIAGRRINTGFKIIFPYKHICDFYYVKKSRHDFSLVMVEIENEDMETREVAEFKGIKRDISVRNIQRMLRKIDRKFSEVEVNKIDIESLPEEVPPVDFALPDPTFMGDDGFDFRPETESESESDFESEPEPAPAPAPALDPDLEAWLEEAIVGTRISVTKDGRGKLVVDKSNPRFQRAYYMFVDGYHLMYDGTTANLQKTEGGGYLIMFFFGVLAGLYKKVIETERDRILISTSISLVFRFKYNKKGNPPVEKNITIKIPKDAYITPRGRLKTFNSWMSFWILGKYPDKFKDVDTHGNATNNLIDKLFISVLQRGVGLRTWDQYDTTKINPDIEFLECSSVTCKINESRARTPIANRRRRANTRIGAENLFWQGIYYPEDRLKKYAKCWPNMVFFKGEHGCVQRAINCKCAPWRSEPYICNCTKEGDYYDVKLEDIVRITREKPIIAIAIFIKTKSDREKDKQWRTFSVIGCNELFYEQENGKVLFVNVPEFNSGRGHCALWVNPKTDKKGFLEYADKGDFNRLIHLLCETDLYVCPMCGEVINYKVRKIHYRMHINPNTCDYCGLSFLTDIKLINHKRYHCKCPRYLAKIDLQEELKGFVEKKDSKEIVNIYADLESAITDTGEHVNILAGWCDDVSHKVHIEDSIEKMITSWVRLSAKELRIYFHNGEGYDFHFLITVFCNMPGKKVEKFEVVNDSSEKIRYFSVYYKGKILHFRDTFAFVGSSLEKWVKSTRDSGYEFPCFSKTFPADKRAELLKKNPFPYNAIKTREDLERPFTDLLGWTVAPNAEELFCFKFSREELIEIRKWLAKIHIDFNWFKVKDYYSDYLRCDVSQLCDVFEFFVKTVKSEYDLDAHQYFGTPGLTWAAWLKQNKFKIEAITDPELYDIVNSSIRGGQTGAMTRYYDSEEEPGTFVCDLDCNSLYATVMLKFKFPCHDWKKILPDQLERLNNPHGPPLPIKTYLDLWHKEGKSGFVELDMVVKDDPKFYSYVPVASKRSLEGIYEYQAMAEYAAMYGTKISNITFSGLTQVVGPHDHYCCHTRLLLWYLEHEVIEIKKIHNVILGVDEPVFRDYVQHNLDKRKEFADDPIKKMLYKLMNNSLYGKTYEDVTRRSNFQLKKREDIDEEKVYREVETFNDWVLYEEVNLVCEINKPFFLGASITEFSKLWMYKFFYDFVRVKFPDTEVMYTDTDALTIKFHGISSLRDLALAINTDDTEEEIGQVIDTSNFSTPLKGECHNKHNNEPGLFKSETGEGRIMKMVALRAKTYIMVCDDGSVKMSVKGCPMQEKKRLNFETFKEVLMGRSEPYSIEYNALRTERHRVFSKDLERIVLSADDRKRYIAEDKIHTFPLFSKEHLDHIGKVTLPHL